MKLAGFLKSLISCRNKEKLIVSFFFLFFFIIGLFIYKDYGIYWDEQANRWHGLKAARFFLQGNQRYFQEQSRCDSAVFELFLAFIEIFFGLTGGSQSAFFMRHLVTFILFFISTFFFYLLSKKQFLDWKTALLGPLFLFLSPRIFANSFYNSIDISFLAVFIIAVFTLINFLEKKNWRIAFFHSFVCAVLIDIRIIGVIIPFLTLLFFAIDLLTVDRRENKIKLISCFLIYTFFLIILTIFFWPVLWENPWQNFWFTFKKMAHYPWKEKVLYFGNYFRADNLPWHYILVSMMTTTPIIYIFLFFIGIICFSKQIIRNSAECYFKYKNELIFFTWFFFPLFMVIFLKSVLYDSWRHLFFVYPAFLLFSLKGLVFINQFIKTKFSGLTFRYIKRFFLLIIGFSLINIGCLMIRYHPFQYVYFNKLIGRDFKKAKQNFDLDYWGLSYKQALGYILDNDSKKQIKIYVINSPGKDNAAILEADKRIRLAYVEEPGQADYFLSNFRGHQEDYPYQQEFYSVKINGAIIMIVYKLK